MPQTPPARRDDSAPAFSFPAVRGNRAVCDLIASDRPLYLFDLARFPNRRVIPPGWKPL
jgi:hypothetical protein